MPRHESPDRLLARTQNFVDYHRDLYLSSGGVDGHIETFSHVGVDTMLPTLLLRTIGRKSGRTSIVPLIYGVYAGDWVIVASKGGAPDHPAWFLNLQADADVAFQVATQAFAATPHVLDGAARTKVWAYMCDLYPPYRDYQRSSGDRVIPVVALRPGARLDVFERPVA